MGAINHTPRLTGALFAGLLLAASPAIAQERGKIYTHADYARAERFMGYNTAPLLDHAVHTVVWQDDRHFWFKDHDADGDHFRRVDAATGAITDAFDHDALAAALAKASGKDMDAARLPVTGFGIAADGRFDIALGKQHYLCDLQREATCEAASGTTTRKPAGDDAPGSDAPVVESPDGRLAAFIRDWNLWVRNTATGVETQLTTDGVTDYGYATDNAGWTHSDRPILVWSPDSTKIATFQQDQRRTSEMVLVSTAIGAPEVERWKYPFVGDEHVTMIERVVIDVPARKVVRLDLPPDQHRSTLCDDVSCYGGWEDVQWAPDSRTLAFASTSRDHKDTWLRVADATTGAVREVYHERVPTYFESGNGRVNWKYLPESNEFIWFSERSDWGHLYLYDLADGTLKHAITGGVGNVTEVLHVDPGSRTLWFRGVGMEDGRNPYYQHFYKVGFDGGEPVLLTPEDANHTVTLSPDGKHFVDAYSTPTVPPVTVLRASDDGRTLATIARADDSRLRATGWVPPTPITVTARDGRTTLYGMMFKPTGLDPSKKYPVVNYIYPGPQTGSVRGRSFTPARIDHQALAELGFVVVAIDGMGTPWRSKSFHDAFNGDVGDNTLPDQVAGLKQLAQRHPWIDLERVGVWGHSGGGYATADAMFTYPDFYKVGISESGNHDNRSYEDDWAEKWQGLEVVDAEGNSNYDAQANQNRAANLQGRLLLAHGMMDDNVPPQNTLLLVDALIKANKDFDLLLFPHARHGFGEDSDYMTRRRWDYFVEHLMGATPPAQYEMKAGKK
ncbi:peptidase S9 [Lysobacter arseniciresistens ZS79]|uniref:Peptidase S9 n=1 Tax=Lysobacter arseniciresistens ZS79 TaxID=913325 RepID=A0A0A0F0I8_9GAMM|nr:S9 family peptidase [Lysobacter arseniciresistens]KGM54912.1 peptidase S9 [Lysobacter arseniciresistens ZS79]